MVVVRTSVESLMGREQQRGVAVNGNEAGGHGFQTPTLSNCSIHFVQFAFPKSDRLLGQIQRTRGDAPRPLQAQEF